jgi:bla regulator protein blaR1
MKIFKVSILTILFLPFIGFSQTIKELKLDSIFKNHPGTFVLWNSAKNEYHVYNKERANQLLPPHSTSKILFSIISLEDKIVKGENDSMKWDSIAHPREDWWPKSWDINQNIVSALKSSNNWYFMELVWKMKQERIRECFKKYDFAKLPDSIGHHYFYYATLARTTAINQVEFLEKLYTNKFHLSKSTVDMISKGMLNENKKNYRLYSKTGGGNVNGENTPALGWTIGFVVRESSVYYYATNIEGKDYDDIKDLRNEISWKALKILKIIE